MVLDNRLNESARLDFNELGFYDVQLLSFSDQDNVWFYDQATDKIHRYNLRLQRATNQSLNISQIVGEENTPTGMVSSVNRVYLNIPTQGVYVFNATGSIFQVLAVRQISDFQIREGKLICLTGWYS
ncbi:MAG: hypothetical protein U5L96_14955 [Owenweeksia sp.]|nr:hypothetical protein [Owenweeksia sp.]